MEYIGGEMAESTKEHKDVSVIIPTYQSMEWIEDCLNSVKEQTYFRDNDYEILAGIDGDDRDTLEKIQEIEDKYEELNVYKFEERLYPAIIRNTLAFREASYDYMLFLDSDDVIVPDTVEEAIESVRDNSFVVFKMEAFRHPDQNDRKKGDYIHSMGVFFVPKKVFVESGGYKDKKFLEDVELLERLTLMGNEKVFLNDKVYLLRRLHEDSLSHNEFHKIEDCDAGWRLDYHCNRFRRDEVEAIEKNINKKYEAV